MSLLLSFIIGLLCIIWSKILFRKWINHLSIYSFSWSLFVFLYQLKLIRYVSVKPETWVIITSTFILFLLGVITFFTARKCLDKPIDLFPPQDKYGLLNSNGKFLRKINMFLVLFTLVGLLGAFQHWYVLINKFGSVESVLVKGNLIYRLRVDEEIEGVIPYLNSFTYGAIFLAGLFTAIKAKLTFRAMLPLVVAILEGMASLGRAGIFLAFLEFIITFVLFRHYLSKFARKFRIKKSSIGFGAVLVIVVFILSTTFIRITRGSNENYKASTTTLRELEESYLITPSIYLYFSSNIGVLSKYFEKDDENRPIGGNTFLPLYNFLSKFGFVESPGFYPKGYYIPMWSNSATYLRELHEDFGFIGVFLVPYLLGLLTTFYWFLFFEKNRLVDFLILVYFTLIISLSTFYTLTRSASWVLSFVMLFVVFTSIKNIKVRK